MENEEMNEEQIDPMQNLLDMLGELQERYGISDEEINAVVDAVNVAFDAEPEEGCEGGECETWTCPECGMEVPASETVCPECGYSLETEGEE